MRRLHLGPIVAAIALCAAATPALADASTTAAPSPGPGVGAVAPKVALKSVFGGKTESFDLQAAAAKKPVVLYFFPAAFSSG